jgi:DNA-directed RNA polymerase I, II, and III subunit RPABC2
MVLSDSDEYDSDNLSTTSSAEGGAKKKNKRPAFLEEDDFVPSEDEEELDEEQIDPDAIDNSDIDSDDDSDDEEDEDEDENPEDTEEINEEDILLPSTTPNKNTQKSQKKSNKKSKKTAHKQEEEDDENDENFIYDENDDELLEDKDEYYQKIKNHVERSKIFDEHPELRKVNHEEIEALSQVVRDAKGRIIDPLHTTLPFLTKYEKADILGKRAAQINEGAPLFTEVDPSIIDGSLIALKEFEEKKIPFIIQRPLPNGAMEYWRLQDLEYL